MRVVYSKRALRDFERFVNFQEPEGDAVETVEIVTEAIELLERHPLMGRPVRGALRELVISVGRTGYLALYRVMAQRVEILSLRHQREAGY